MSNPFLRTTATCDAGDMRESDTPVWIIGGGKTAMDTAHTLITEYPGREVNLVAGSRNVLRRPATASSLTGDRAMVGRHDLGVEASPCSWRRRFDGTNETEVCALVSLNQRHDS